MHKIALETGLTDVSPDAVHLMTQALEVCKTNIRYIYIYSLFYTHSLIYIYYYTHSTQYIYIHIHFSTSLSYIYIYIYFSTLSSKIYIFNMYIHLLAGWYVECAIIFIVHSTFQPPKRYLCTTLHYTTHISILFNSERCIYFYIHTYYTLHFSKNVHTLFNSLSLSLSLSGSHL